MEQYEHVSEIIRGRIKLEKQNFWNWNFCSPHVNDLAYNHTGLICFGLPKLIEKQLKITHYSEGPLPALLYPCGLRDLKDTTWHCMFTSTSENPLYLTLIH